MAVTTLIRIKFRIKTPPGTSNGFRHFLLAMVRPNFHRLRCRLDRKILVPTSFLCNCSSVGRQKNPKKKKKKLIMHLSVRLHAYSSL